MRPASLSSSASLAVRKSIGVLTPSSAEPPGHLDAVEVGQHDVEDDQVRWVVFGLTESGAAVGRLFDVEPLVAKRCRDGVDYRRFVVHDEDLLAASGL